MQESIKTFIQYIADQEKLSQKFSNSQRIFELDVAFRKLHGVVLKNEKQIFTQINKVTNNQTVNFNLKKSDWLKWQKKLQAFVFQKSTLKPKETSYAILVT